MALVCTVLLTACGASTSVLGPAPDATTGAAVMTDLTPSPDTASEAAVAAGGEVATVDLATHPEGTCAGCGVPEVVHSPDLGVFSDQGALVAALLASGPLDNEKADAVAQGRAPNQSICASIVETTEPTAGAVIHQALATMDGQTGVVLVFERADGSDEVRMYGTGDADPVTGGCPLRFKALL
jgi:hypothetical protein